MTYDEHLAEAKANRLKLIKRNLTLARNALERVDYYIREDYPEGGIFIDNGETINALTDTSVEHRQQSILCYTRFIDGVRVGVGGW